MHHNVLRVSESANRALIVHNPTAGRGHRASQVARLAELLVDRGIAAEVHTELNGLERRVAELVDRDELRAVVAAGGDGTVAELANRLASETPLAVLPLGTENLLAKYVGQRGTPEAVCQTICDGWLIPCDAGLANGRIFLLMASAGFDAEVVRRLAERRGGNISHASWIKPIWRTVRSYEYPPLRVYLSGEDPAQPLVARWVFVVNLPKYARGLQFTPDAAGCDGQLDVCLFEKGSFLQGLKYLRAVIRGRHQSLPDCRIVRATGMRIESDWEVAYQVDGDAGGRTPLEIECLPNRVTLAVPEEFIQAPAAVK
jgi:diacylglycerol kinase family enzyme